MLTLSNNRERERKKRLNISLPFKSGLGTPFRQTLKIVIFLSSLRIESNRREGVAREYANICPDANIAIFFFTVSPRRIDCKFDLRIQIDITLCSWGKVYRVHKLHRRGYAFIRFEGGKMQGERAHRFFKFYLSLLT